MTTIPPDPVRPSAILVAVAVLTLLGIGGGLAALFYLSTRPPDQTRIAPEKKARQLTREEFTVVVADDDHSESETREREKEEAANRARKVESANDSKAGNSREFDSR